MGAVKEMLLELENECRMFVIKTAQNSEKMNSLVDESGNELLEELIQYLQLKLNERRKPSNQERGKS